MARHSKSDGFMALQLLQLFLYFVPILTAVITLSYLGMTFREDEVDIDPQDWRRKWLIFFAWLTLVVMVLNILMASVSLTMVTK